MKIENYTSPDVELIKLELPLVICQSGNIEDMTVESELPFA